MKIVLDGGSEISLEDFVEAGKFLGPHIRDELDYQILIKLQIAAMENGIDLQNKGVE